MATLRSKEFSCSIPDVSFASTGRALVSITIDSELAYEEWLYPSSGTVSVRDLPELVTPYARQRQMVSLAISATDEEGATLFSTQAEVVYCQADFGDVTASSFLSEHFLSILMGTKVTAMGRLEYLHMQGSDEASCTATYSDGTTATFAVPVVQRGGAYRSLDVSPDRFTTPGKVLTRYTINAGRRSQDYEIDLTRPDCAPILVFVNSFGMDELAYCTGIHKVDPTYKRHSTYMGNVRKNYRIDETRAFQADSGPLTVAMANWWDELFRSDSVRVVNIYDGVPNVGKDLLVTDSKSAMSNDDAEIPRFTFTYQYAQRNHNVVQLLRAGRIFDNTFDNTFN
jgi:hypothetical protein